MRKKVIVDYPSQNHSLSLAENKIRLNGKILFFLCVDFQFRGRIQMSLPEGELFPRVHRPITIPHTGCGFSFCTKLSSVSKYLCWRHVLVIFPSELVLDPVTYRSTTFVFVQSHKYVNMSPHSFSTYVTVRWNWYK